METIAVRGSRPWQPSYELLIREIGSYYCTGIPPGDCETVEMEPALPQASSMNASTGPPTQGATPLPTRIKQSKPKKEKISKPHKEPSGSKSPTKPKKKSENVVKPTPTDPDAMFKVGFLSDVYNERPAEKVVTRCTFCCCNIYRNKSEKSNRLLGT